MENASKALIMAGSILTAIIIIGFLTKTKMAAKLFQKVYLSEEEQAQLVEYNEQYTKYLGEYVYGTEIVTIINKHNDKNYVNNTDYNLEVNIKFKTDYTYRTQKYVVGSGYVDDLSQNIPAGESLILNTTNADVQKSHSINLGSIRNRAFKCTSIEYDILGRVNKIKFEEID